jgi:hypothetical protein
MRLDAIGSFQRSKTDCMRKIRDMVHSHLHFPGIIGENFTFTLNVHDEYQFYILGCQGEDGKAQRAVAASINNRIRKHSGPVENVFTNEKQVAGWENVTLVEDDSQREPPKLLDNVFGLFLGDNFYPGGVTSADDAHFVSQFSNLYSQDVYWFSALGNHDWNMQNRVEETREASKNPRLTKLQRALFQVEHTYLVNDKWFMPFRYYVLDAHYANIFILDSNTFYWDRSQQDWLVQRYQALNKDPMRRPKKNIIAMHHPLKTIGKRHPDAGSSDVGQYWLPDYDALPKTPGDPCDPNDLKKSKRGYLNQLLLEKFVEIKNRPLWKDIKFPFYIDKFIGAHDHFLARYNIDVLERSEQLISGGGGGSLQDKHVDPGSGTFDKSHGYLHLHLTSRDCIFKHEKPNVFSAV